MDSKELTQYVADLKPEKAIWINNSARPATSGETFPVIDPATASPITDVSSGTAADASAALDAAASAQPGWAARTPRERAEILRRAWELMIAS
ncbi:MAG: aldehyde dehydrogenase family protein, partial [Varibaculum cambriense]|nr:aldehyde dehydrogenase family protein [Varibaculum cambriense]